MKLNKECIRDVLLYIETECQYYMHQSIGRVLNRTSYENLCKAQALSKYDSNDIYYTVSKLLEGGYIQGDVYPNPKDYSNFTSAIIDGLTLSGHELLDNIRPETVWQETKNVMQRVGDFSIGIMSQVAGEVMASYTKVMINMP